MNPGWTSSRPAGCSFYGTLTPETFPPNLTWERGGIIQGDPVVANSLVRDLKRVGKVTLNCYSSFE